MTPGAIPGTAAGDPLDVGAGRQHRDRDPRLAAAAAAAAPGKTPTKASASIATMAERTFIKFTFLKIDPAWQRREGEQRAQDKREMLAACEDYAVDRPLRAYSTVGTRGDTRPADRHPEPAPRGHPPFHVVLAQSGLAQWASIPYSYLAMTKPSPYSDSQTRPELLHVAPPLRLHLPDGEEARVVRACRPRSAAGS